MGFDSELGKQFDAYCFELSNVLVDTEAESPQVQDGIENELARIVGGYAASPADLDEVDISPGQLFWRNEELVGALAGAEGNNGRVLDYKHGVWDLGLLPFLVQLFLPLEDLPVVGEAAVADIQGFSCFEDRFHGLFILATKVRTYKGKIRCEKAQSRIALCVLRKPAVKPPAKY